MSFHPHSFGDEQVRLFRWNGQIYRGITSARARFFKQLFERNIIQRLVEKDLFVQSELTPFSLEDYEIVVRHRDVAFASYPNEWCGAMLRDAALKIIDLALELARHGLTLSDAHPWNLLFDIEHGKLVFVDLGSIAPLTDFTWSVYEEFCRFCFYPLLLMSHGQEQIARLLMCENTGVTETDVANLIGVSTLSASSRYRSLLQRAEGTYARTVSRWRLQWQKNRSTCRHDFVVARSGNLAASESEPSDVRQASHVAFLESVRKDLERIRLSFANIPTEDTRNQSLGSVLAIENGPSNQCFLRSALTELRPRTVLDIGSGKPSAAELAAALGSRVVYWDTDSARVTQLYARALATQLPILPLIMDFTKPTPARGLANHWSIAAMERFRCDMVLASGPLLERTVRQRRLNFQQIFDGLASLSKRWVISEFISGTDNELNSPPLPSWYTPNNFLDAARKRFSRVDIMPSSKKTPVWVIGEKTRCAD